MELDSTSGADNGELRRSKQGCSGLLAIILLSMWVVSSSVIAQVIHWSLVQTIFDGSIKIPDFRWAVLSVYAILLLIPIGIAFFVVKDGVYRERFKRLGLISVLALFLSLARFAGITEWQKVVVIQVGVSLVFVCVYWFFTRKKFQRTQSYGQPFLSRMMLAAAAGAVLGIPWVMWGAQGSKLDTLLALIAAVLLGIVVATVLIPDESDQLNLYVDGKNTGLAGAGWTITLGLLILATAADQNGNGWLLTGAVLPLGFANAALTRKLNGAISGVGKAMAGLISALGFAWPMIMIDPDELSPIIASGSGELLDYALKAFLFAFGLAIFISVLLIIYRKWHQSENINLLVASGIFLLSWAGLLVLYGFQGTPGNYGERIFVILKDQSNLSTMGSITDSLTRREAVYQKLVEHAIEDQQDLRTWLDARGITYKPYYLVNAIELEADPVLRAQLAERSDVDRVLDSPVLRPLAEEIPIALGIDYQPTGYGWNLTLIGARKVHTEFDVEGSGIIIGQSDSGVQGDHPEFAERYRGAIEGSDDYNWFDPWFKSKSPVDIGGHGTHTLGSILGENVGVAPAAEWIGCVNLGRNLGNPALYLDCMQFMLAPFPADGDPFKDGKPEKGANVLNNSWGCPDVEGCDPETYLPAVKALREAGVFVVASAGNSGMGGCSTVQDPLAIYEDVYTVGAINENGNIAGFSSLGPVTVDGSGRTKPDIAAPGVDVISSYPGSSYELNSGTSMAGPHVVGVVALMWSANPDLIGNIDRTREILNQTADPLSGIPITCGLENELPDNITGYGVVNAYKAVLKALNEK